MDSLKYLDFELQVERAGDGYRAEVLRSPVGEAKSTFTLPFTPETLENLILKLGTRRGRTRGVTTNELLAARELGGNLFDAVFTGDVRACLRRSLDLAESQPDTGLRLKLRLQTVGELADLPWEFLYDASQGRFLAQSNYTPLVRYVEMPQRIRPLAIELPLRVLVMIAAPDDPDFARLDVDHEKARVQEAFDPLLKTGRVEIDWLEHATLAQLRDALRNNTYHAFHFIGHGSFDPGAQEGLLILEDEANRGVRAGAHRIGPLLHDHRSLRLAVLNACEGARNSREDPFSGIATSLVRQGIPAVVAMQFEITDNAAITFAHGFYSAIAEGYPVDMAVADARSAILVQPNDIEWATPVLYMRSPDGHLFDLSAAAPLAPGVLTYPVTEPVERLSEDEGQPEARDVEPAPVLQDEEPEPTIAGDEALAAVPAESAVEPAPRTADVPADAVEGLPEPADVSALELEPPPVAQPVSLRLRALGYGLSGLSRARNYRLGITNSASASRDLTLEAHMASEGYRTSLPSAISVPAGETKTLGFTISPEQRRWRGRRYEVPFTIAAGGGDGEPPVSVGGLFEDRPENIAPYAGGSIMGIGALGVAAVLLLGGGDNGAIAQLPQSTETPAATMGATTDPGQATVVVPTEEPRPQERIIFSSTRGGGSHDIYAMAPDGSAWERLTNDPANDVMPAATLDGSRIAFVSNRTGHDQVFVMNGDGSEVTQVMDDHLPNLEPDPSPDGRSIAFERRVSDTHYEIWLALPDGTFPPISIEGDIDPDWLPDGTRMVFASNRDGNNEIYVGDADGRNQVRLTDNLANDVEPAYSPGGSKILFESNRDGNPEIYMMNPDGTEQQRLTFDPANDQDPAWSPDSRRIAFETDRDGNWEVYIMDLETGDLTNFSNHPGEDRKPSWSRVSP